MTFPEFDLSQVANADETCWTPLIKGVDPDNLPVKNDAFGTPRRLHPETAALICAAPHIGLSSLTPGNVAEWLFRLESLFNENISFMGSATPEGPVPMRIPVSAVLRHIGLTIPGVTPYSDIEFVTLWKARCMQRHYDALATRNPTTDI